MQHLLASAPLTHAMPPACPPPATPLRAPPFPALPVPHTSTSTPTTSRPVRACPPAAEPPEALTQDPLLTESFMAEAYAKYTAPQIGAAPAAAAGAGPAQASNPAAPAPGAAPELRPFAIRQLNVVDPLLPNNNLGRSVSKASYLRIRRAFEHGARLLAQIAEQAKVRTARRGASCRVPVWAALAVVPARGVLFCRPGTFQEGSAEGWLDGSGACRGL